MHLAIDLLADIDRLFDRMIAFVDTCYAHGHDGKTLVLGCAPGGASTAFAIGLSSASQQKQLVLMARYLFARNNVNRYLLAMPVWAGDAGDQESVVMELVRAGERWHGVAIVSRNSRGRYEGLEKNRPTSAPAPLLEDLLVHGHSLPGIMRRELDRAYEVLRIDAGELCRQLT